MSTSTDEESIFAAALEYPDPQARAEYVDRVCGGDPKLRQRVAMLLSAYGEGEFLEAPPHDVLATAAYGEVSERPGSSIGPYKLLEQIGEGGMGLVFMAEQTQPIRRRVALKIIKPGLDTHAVVARFEAERQALALMDHPNIARVYDAGATSTGRPYFVMELVRGIPITDYCRDHELGLRERLELFISVCQAVQHAHQKGIIHRDLKPSNILVAHDDTRPVPKVIDFGVAKATTQQLTERTLFTHFAQLIGTPLYMSPEQAEFNYQDVDTRSDVYSLGVVLYELLTGTTPFEAERLRSAGPDEMRRIIREEDPPRPSTRATTMASAASPKTTEAALQGLGRGKVLGTALRGDLDWIVMKCLEKDRRRRYESASALAADIQRHLDGEMIFARPVTVTSRLVKWSRRHVAAIWTAVGVLFLATVLLGGSTLLVAASRNELNAQRLIATEERDKAVSERETAVAERNNARLQQYYAEIISGQSDLAQGNLGGLYQKLIHHLPLGEHPDRRGWEWYYLFSQCHPEERAFYYPGYGIHAVWSPDGRYIGTTGAIWDVRSGECVQLIEPSLVWTVQCAWSPDSQQLAMGAVSPDSAIYIWHLKERRLRVFRGHESSVWALDFSPDGKRLASGGINEAVCIWDMATGELLHSIPHDSGNSTSIEWSPDGQLLAIGIGSAQGLQIYDTSNWQPVPNLPRVSGAAVNVSWRPDGRQLAVNSPHKWFILNRDDWSVVVEHDHPWADDGLEGMDIAWNPSGTLVAYTMRTVVDIWDPVRNRVERRLSGNVDQVRSLSWDPDGSRLLTADSSHRIRIWEVGTPSKSPTIELEGPLQSLAWGNSGTPTLEAVKADDLSTVTWNMKERVRVGDPAPVVQRQGMQVLSPDGSWVANWAYPTDKSSVVVYDARTGDIESVLTPKLPFKPLETGDAVSWSPDGARLAIAICSKGESGFEVWDVKSESRVSHWARLPVRSSNWVDLAFRQVAWSPDGKWVAAIGRGEAGTQDKWVGRVHVVNADAGERVADLIAESEGPEAFAWSPDSRLMAIATSEGTICVTDIATGNRVGKSKPHDLAISALAWSPDGQRLASSSIDGSLSLVAPRGGHELLRHSLRGGAAKHLAWSHDGTMLAAATDGAIEVLDATNGYAFAPGEKREAELAWVYLNLENEGGAEGRSALESVVKLAPRRLDYRVLRAHTFAGLRQYERCAQEFASLLSPNLEESLQSAYYLLYAHLGAGNVDAYNDLLRQVNETIWNRANAKPSNGNDIFYRAHSLRLTGLSLARASDFTPHLNQLNRYLAEADPEQRDSLNRYMGGVLYRLGRYDEAVRVLEGGPDQPKSATQRLFLAMAHHRLGHHDQARQLLSEALPDCHRIEQGSLHWRDMVALKTVRTEAQSLIGLEEVTSEISVPPE